MTAHQRRTEHRMIFKRQGPVIPFPGDDDEGDNGPGNGGDGPGNPGNGNGGGASSSTPVPPPPSSTPAPPSSTPPPPRPPPSSSTIRPSSTPPPPPPPPSSSQEPSNTISQSASVSASISASISASVSRSTSSGSSLSRPTQNLRPNTSSYGVAPSMSVAPGVISADDNGTDTSSDNTGASSSNTGGIIGGVLGGLAGLAALVIIVMFLLRKLRKRRQEEEDFGTDFRRSAFVQDSRPGSMAQTGHAASPSIVSPGIAGKGAYSAAYYDSNGNEVPATEAHAGYGATGTAAAAAAAASLQERPKYVYGQADSARQDDELSEHAHGIYSSQPMVQTSYNPEAYGSYAAYDASTGYQDATREFQGQEGYAVSGDAYAQNYNYGQQGAYAQQGAYVDNPQQSYTSHPYSQGFDNTQYAPYSDQHGTYDAAQYAQYDAYANGAVATSTDHTAVLAAASTSTAAATAAPAANHKASKPSVANTEDAYGGM